MKCWTIFLEELKISLSNSSKELAPDFIHGDPRMHGTSQPRGRTGALPNRGKHHSKKYLYTKVAFTNVPRVEPNARRVFESSLSSPPPIWTRGEDKASGKGCYRNP